MTSSFTSQSHALARNDNVTERHTHRVEREWAGEGGGGCRRLERGLENLGLYTFIFSFGRGRGGVGRPRWRLGVWKGGLHVDVVKPSTLNRHLASKFL
jgi:hypothetical protein